MSEIYSGLVIGGPLDGKRLDHYSIEYRVPVSDDLLPVRAYSADVAPTMATIKTFDYVHYRMLVASFWIPVQIRRGGRYENRYYDCPMDFVLLMLTRGYRPEGY